ncbi:MAG: 4Fe-4S binding protein, partial [Gammaproteobacteria bacterium]|nr:4Fe-4S binding protein [Gammaproteobacteria bacterium]
MKNSTETLLKEELDPVKGASFNVAITAALNAAKEIAIEPTSLVSYQCKNNVLIIGDDQRVAHVISQLSASMAMTVLISSKESEVDLESIPDSISIAYGKLTSLSGYLGSFNAELTVKGQQVNLATVYNTKLNSFDLVIDLNKNPVLNQSLLPFGYFSPQNDFELEEVIRTFPDMLGEFEKPKFFEYNADICAHGNSGLKACQRCINACPAEAIISIKDLIKVNPYLCQGGGTCATVCPTGAIQYVYPRLQDTIGKVRSMLKAYYDAGGEQAAIAFYGAEESALYEQAALENYIPFQLEEIASIGMDVWLSAFAFGARDVVLLTHEHTLKEVNETLDTQLSYAHAIIEGMGFESSC